MSPADRWTLADVSAHYVQHPELRNADQTSMPLVQPTEGARELFAQKWVILGLRNQESV